VPWSERELRLGRITLGCSDLPKEPTVTRLATEVYAYVLGREGGDTPRTRVAGADQQILELATRHKHPVESGLRLAVVSDFYRDFTNPILRPVV
jgi:hypothetical protein